MDGLTAPRDRPTQPAQPVRPVRPGPSHTLHDTKGHNGSFTSVLLNASSSLTDFSQAGVGESSGRESSFDLASHHSYHSYHSYPRRPQPRGQCRRCVECTRLTEHRVVDHSKTLWPGQCASPITYFTVSRRRLEHQIASVPRTSRIWVQDSIQQRLSGLDGSLAVRRGVAHVIDDLMIPITKTNVAYKASNVTLIGMKTLSVTTISRKDSKRRCMSWRRDDGDHKGENSSVSLQPSPFAASSLPDIVVLDSRLASTGAHQPLHTSQSKSRSLNKQDSAVPMLLSRQSSGLTSMSIDDPTMQEYVQHQYAIKREQAFACNHAIDIADVAKEAEVKSSSSKKFFGFFSNLHMGIFQ